MKKLLVPVLFLAACADTPAHDADQLNAEGDMTEPGGSPTTGTPATPENALFAIFNTEPNDCADNTVRLMGRWGYPDGTQPDSVSCRFELLDGTVIADTCFAVRSMPTSEVVLFTVTDLGTGEVATHQDFAQGPASFTTSVTASSDGLSISWDAQTMYGNVAGAGGLSISITPSANVIVTDPMVFGQRTGTVNVTQEGTYTVHVHGGISFGEHGGCGADAEATIEVVCDPAMHDMHEH